MNAYEDSDLYVAPPEGLAKAAGDPASADTARAAADPDADIDVGADADAAEGVEQQVLATAGGEHETAAVRPQIRRRLASRPAAPRHWQPRQSAGSGRRDRLQMRRSQARRQRRRQLRQQHQQQQHQQQHQQRRSLLQARQQAAADAARRDWEVRQRALRDAVPWGLWKRSRAAWGSDLLPWWVTGTCHRDARHVRRCMAAVS